jgi:hypothetical protein
VIRKLKAIFLIFTSISINLLNYSRLSRKPLLLFRSFTGLELPEFDSIFYKDEHPITPPNVKNYYDLGYVGEEKDFPNVKAVLPVKKKHNIELTEKEKIYNKRHRRQRVIE